jgi:hypothetical protein
MFPDEMLLAINLLQLPTEVLLEGAADIQHLLDYDLETQSSEAPNRCLAHSRFQVWPCAIVVDNINSGRIRDMEELIAGALQEIPTVSQALLHSRDWQNATITIQSSLVEVHIRSGGQTSPLLT